MTFASSSPRRWHLYLAGLWTLPWQAHDRGQRWFMSVLAALALALGSVLACFDRPHAGIALALFTGVIDGVLWAYFLPASVRLVRAARRGCLPRAERRIQASLLLYLLLGTIAPALLLGMLGAPVAVVAVSLLAVCGGALLYATLPIFLSSVLCCLPALLPTLVHANLDLPAPDSSGFVVAMGLFSTGLLLLGAASWWRVCSQSSIPGALRRTLVDAFDRKVGFTGIKTGENVEVTGARLRPDWLQPRYVLAGTGPCNPRRSLRVALGNTWAPATFGSQLRPLLLGLGSITTSLVFTGYLLHRVFDVSHGFLSLFTTAVGWFLVFIAIFQAVASMLALRQRWSLVNAELPLLALLPGLGKRIKSDLLVVCLRRMLATWNVLLILAWLLMMYGSHAARAVASIVIFGLAVNGSLLIVAGLLGVLGHAGLGLWGRIGLTLSLLIMNAGSAVSQLLARFDATATPLVPVLGWWAAFECLSALLTLLYIRHAWRRWQGLSHLFLAREG